MFPSRRTTMGGDVFRDEHSMYFDGVDDSIHFQSNIAGTFNETPATSAGHTDPTVYWNTITCWVKLDGTSSPQRLWNVEGANCGWLFAAAAADWDLGYNTGNSDRLGIRDAQSNWTGIWKHCIMSWEVNTGMSDNTALDDSTAGLMLPLLWVDGVKQTVAYNGGTANSNSTNLNDQSVLAIGSNAVDGGSNTQDLKGYIADLALYKRKFDNNMAKTVYNGREPFNHNSWSTGANYLTLWARMGDTAGDTATGLKDASNFGNGSTETADGSPILTGDTP